MPTRSRQHTTAARGMTLLRSHLPPSWTFIEIPEQADYGIDAEIEIFVSDSEGGASATGYTFKAQSRATESDSLIVYLSRRQYNYMHSLDVPVLIVRSRVTTDELYAAWLHSRPVHPTASGERLRFVLDQRDRWMSATPEALVESVRAYRLIHQRTAFPPVEIRVPNVSYSGERGEFHSSMLVDALSTATGSVSHLVRVRLGEPAPDTATISPMPGGTRIEVGEVASRTVPPLEAKSPESYETAAADLLYCLADLLALVGYGALALRLAAAVIPNTFYTRSLTYGSAIVAAAATDSLLLPDAVRLCRVAGEATHPLESALWSQLLLQMPRLPPAEASVLADLLGSRASLEQNVIPLVDLSVALSHQLLRENLGDEAVALWSTLFQHVPSIGDSYAALRARAGAEFLVFEFVSAAEHYEAALALAPEDQVSETRALLGDAYLRLGRVAEARDLFRHDLENPEWQLKFIGTSYLIDVLGLRQLSEAPNFEFAGSIDFANLSDSQAVIRETVESAVTSGPDSLLWFNAASRLSQLDELVLTAQFSLIAAVLGDPYDPESLALAIVRWMSALSLPACPSDAALKLQLLVQVAAQKYGRSILSWYDRYDLPSDLLTNISELIDLFVAEVGSSSTERGRERSGTIARDEGT